MGDTGDADRFSAEIPEGKRPLGRYQRRWEGNVRMDFQDVKWEGMEWTDLAPVRDRWQALVIAIRTLGTPRTGTRLLHSSIPRDYKCY